MLAEGIKLHYIYIPRHIFLIVNRAQDYSTRQFLFAILLFLITKISALAFDLNRHRVGGKIEKVKGRHTIIAFANISPQSHSQMFERPGGAQNIGFLYMRHLRLMVFDNPTNFRQRPNHQLAIQTADLFAPKRAYIIFRGG